MNADCKLPFLELPQLLLLSHHKTKMSPSSSYEIILTSSPDGPILAYLASTGESIGCFIGSRSPHRGLVLAGEGYIAASHVSSDTARGSIHLYNWCTSSVFHNIPVPEPVAPIIATADGSFLLAGGVSGCIHSLSLPSGDIHRSIRAHSKPISSIHLNGDGSLVISGSDDGTIVVIPTLQLLDASENGEDPKDLILFRLEAHSNSVTALNTGKGQCRSTLISCSLDCTCKIWCLENGILLRKVEFPCSIYGFVLDPSESEFYAAGSDGLVYKCPIYISTSKSHELLVSWSQRQNGSILSLVIVNEGRNLVSAADDGSVWMWDVEKGEVIMNLGNEMGNITDMILARSSGHNKNRGKNNNKFAGEEIGEFSFGLSDMEITRPLEKIMEIGEILAVVVEDKKRAIDLLESGINLYEKLLELILKEAMKGAGSVTASNEETEKEEKEEHS